MEKQLFSWEEFEDVNSACFNFYNCILKEDIGEYKEGESFDIINVDFEKGRIELYNNESGDIEAQFELKLEIGDKVK